MVRCIRLTSCRYKVASAIGTSSIRLRWILYSKDVLAILLSGKPARGRRFEAYFVWDRYIPSVVAVNS